MSGNRLLIMVAAFCGLVSVILSLHGREPRLASDSQQVTSDELEVLDRAFTELLAGLLGTFKPMASDATVIEEFKRNRAEYEAVVNFVLTHPEYSRFDRTIDPPTYYSFMVGYGRIAELDPSITRLLLSTAVPAVIDGDLRPTTQYPRLNFQSFSSGTVVRGMSKGIAYVPKWEPAVLLNELDDLNLVTKSLRAHETNYSYRHIEGNWYLWVRM
jgi:hypothetical protein